MKIHRLAYQAYADVLITPPRTDTNISEKVIIKPRIDIVEISKTAKAEYEKNNKK